MRTFPPEIKETIIVSQDRFVWEAPSHDQYARGPRWYVFMALTAVFLVAYAIYAANFLFAFLILLMAIILVLAGNETPKIVLAQIGDNGVVWDGHLHLFQDIDNFAIIYEPPATKILYLETKSTLSPRLRIPLENEDPVALRQHLKRYLQENSDLHDEYLSDIVGRVLRI